LSTSARLVVNGSIPRQEPAFTDTEQKSRAKSGIDARHKTKRFTALFIMRIVAQD
jgi:hypothetical protein